MNSELAGQALQRWSPPSNLKETGQVGSQVMDGVQPSLYLLGRPGQSPTHFVQFSLSPVKSFPFNFTLRVFLRPAAQTRRLKHRTMRLLGRK